MPDKKKPGKKAYALRINGDILDAVHRWADDELRSVNAQIEFIIRDALRREGRIKKPEAPKAIALDDE
ncbi:Arc family DNA-binding protein [Kordiimonas laminariae]|uniref:Arc family DNA-binding protein n=1 Tax=Kordiimonas laminariae TaxID=2917717 RepID=UPI001FF25766|nr:Arc family DNA-binding protein [Kordiimonas laminariae]MCK0069071.1 Arc family DNA-binding protein [Kordiimonas laminariae]